MFKRNIKITAISFLSICIIYCCFKSNSDKMYFPLGNAKYILTSEYGYRTFDNSFHDGIDLATIEDTPVYSMYNGIVTYSGFDTSGGYMMIISYDNGYKSMYCHLSYDLKFSNGDRVIKGQIIGYVGPKYLENGRLNGYTTGVHLHFGLSKNGISIDPLSLSYD